jgi:hypothetical protein
LPLLEAFHTSLELYQAPPSCTRDELRERIERRLQKESELVLAPEFFESFAQAQSDVAGVEIELKRGAAHNELTKFRYDVVIRKRGARPGGSAATKLVPGQAPGAEPVVLRAEECPTLEAIQERLKSRPAALRVTGLSNPRLLRELRALELLRDPERAATLADLGQALDGAPALGPDPQALYAADPGYEAHLTWSDAGLDRYDALFVARGAREAAHAAEWVRDPKLDSAPKTRAPEALVRVAQKDTASRLPGELRAHARDRLPDFMVPSAFVLLDELPLTPNGKIDRKALPAPERSRQASAKAFTPPSSDTERAIAAIWQELLGLEQVGVNDNFFDIGANSLLVMRANGRISAALGKAVSLVDMFRFPTVSSLSAHLLRSGSPEAAGARALEVGKESLDRAQTRKDAMQRRRGLMERARGPAKS